MISRRSLLAGAAALVSSKALPSVGVAAPATIEPAVVNIGLSVEMLVQDYVTETMKQWVREWENMIIHGSGSGEPSGIFRQSLDKPSEITFNKRRETVHAQRKERIMTPKSIAKIGANVLSAEIADMLKRGEEVNIPGLGRFKTISKAARTGRNPRTGEAVEIPARKAVKYSQTSTLKAALNPA